MLKYYSEHVKNTIMPKGVEHSCPTSRAVSISSVKNSMMPKGVEHYLSACAIPLGDGIEESHDAERR